MLSFWQLARRALLKESMSFVQDIIANPDPVTLLVYADWLEERDELPALRAYLRCAAAPATPEVRDRPGVLNDAEQECGNLFTAARDELADRGYLLDRRLVRASMTLRKWRKPRPVFVRLTIDGPEWREQSVNSSWEPLHPVPDAIVPALAALAAYQGTQGGYSRGRFLFNQVGDASVDLDWQQTHYPNDPRMPEVERAMDRLERMLDDAPAVALPLVVRRMRQLTRDGIFSERPELRARAEDLIDRAYDRARQGGEDMTRPENWGRGYGMGGSHALIAAARRAMHNPLDQGAMESLAAALDAARCRHTAQAVRELAGHYTMDSWAAHHAGGNHTFTHGLGMGRHDRAMLDELRAEDEGAHVSVGASGCIDIHWYAGSSHRPRLRVRACGRGEQLSYQNLVRVYTSQGDDSAEYVDDEAMNFLAGLGHAVLDIACFCVFFRVIEAQLAVNGTFAAAIRAMPRAGRQQMLSQHPHLQTLA